MFTFLEQGVIWFELNLPRSLYSRFIRKISSTYFDFSEESFSSGYTCDQKLGRGISSEHVFVSCSVFVGHLPSGSSGPKRGGFNQATETFPVMLQTFYLIKPHNLPVNPRLTILRFILLYRYVNVALQVRALTNSYVCVSWNPLYGHDEQLPLEAWMHVPPLWTYSQKKDFQYYLCLRMTSTGVWSSCLI